MNIKMFGIFGIVKNDILIEYGKVELGTSDLKQNELLEVKFTSAFQIEQNPYFSTPIKYIELNKDNTLGVFSPCCDFFNQHYTKVK